MSEFPPPTLEDLKDLAGGTMPNDAPLLYDRLKFLVHDVKGRALWQTLRSEDKKLDRDAVVVRVWSELETTHKKVIEEQYHSLEYHRVWLFYWLLQRYDVRNARRVVGGGRWARNAHFLILSAVLTAFVVLRLNWLGSHQTQWAAVLCGIVYAAALVGLAKRFKHRLSDRLEALALATHSLIPRLAGAGAVGLLFLASSLDLVPRILNTKWWWLVGLLAASYGYLLLEMARRIHPLPRLRRLLLLGVDVAATALAHSFTLVLLAEGFLRRSLPAGPGGPAPFTGSEAFSLVVFVFSIGLIVNVIWAEQPVTEPL